MHRMMKSLETRSFSNSICPSTYGKTPKALHLLCRGCSKSRILATPDISSQRKSSLQKFRASERVEKSLKKENASIIVNLVSPTKKSESEVHISRPQTREKEDLESTWKAEEKGKNSLENTRYGDLGEALEQFRAAQGSIQVQQEKDGSTYLNDVKEMPQLR